jgi:Ca2+-binding EF-hand superfamily protein
MRNLLLAGATAVAVIAIAPAVAQEAPPPGVGEGTEPITHVETRVLHMPRKAETRDQMVAHVREMFAKLDTDKDGALTKEEARAAHKAMGADFHKKFTARLDKGDFPHPDRGAMFDKLDTNKDGSITRQEFLAAKPDIKEHRVIVMRDGDGPPKVEIDGKPVVDGDGGPGKPHVKIMRSHGMGMAMHGRMFEMADANKDGRVTLQEMTNAAAKHFDEADANRDGTLTPEERMQMHQRKKAERAKPA